MNGISSSLKASIGLPALARLELGDLVGVLLDRVGELEQRERALARRGRSPSRRTRARGGGDRAVDVLLRRSAATWAISSPVAGLRTGVGLRPQAASTNSPSMKFCSVAAVVVLMRVERYHLA